MMFRVEDKYNCSEREMFLLQSRLKLFMDPDRYSDDSVYRVTSLYFDDYDDISLKETEDGVSHRKKYRIRIYNGSTDVIKLEVKYKKYNRVLKKSKIITKSVAEELIMGNCIENEFGYDDDPITLFNLAIMRDFLRPRIVVDYMRKAFTYEPGNVRITFDTDIRSSNDINGFLDDRCMYYTEKYNNRILEVKYDEMIPNYIKQLLETDFMEQVSYSKYRLCRELMGGK